MTLLITSSVVLGPQVEPMDGTTWHVKVFVLSDVLKWARATSSHVVYSPAKKESCCLFGHLYKGRGTAGSDCGAAPNWHAAARPTTTGFWYFVESPSARQRASKALIGKGSLCRVPRGRLSAKALPRATSALGKG